MPQVHREKSTATTPHPGLCNLLLLLLVYSYEYFLLLRRIPWGGSFLYSLIISKYSTSTDTLLCWNAVRRNSVLSGFAGIYLLRVCGFPLAGHHLPVRKVGEISDCCLADEKIGTCWVKYYFFTSYLSRIWLDFSPISQIFRLLLEKLPSSCRIFLRYLLLVRWSQTLARWTGVLRTAEQKNANSALNLHDISCRDNEVFGSSGQHYR